MEVSPHALQPLYVDTVGLELRGIYLVVDGLKSFAQPPDSRSVLRHPLCCEHSQHEDVAAAVRREALHVDSSVLAVHHNGLLDA